ncbi:lipopolysaccharide assembly protein LapB [Larsenimonas suaedae]|uniref:Lipopolysaccharide assembly protein B n=1 Tax=Larsenimonas suaedae TaxID=1851019 RepID=A0ABU1GV44_9GAMM|nr:lipopolysaccharide assembly protein LapB [Larsenimonas suaedae]MCM2971184.1 lipopolysaccharide assembly protein LapB [Larsenimonas suaedae]MDR5895893.1 lipopolysaccharide assembly protein LapB [Larsenimonas suaedae]
MFDAGTFLLLVAALAIGWALGRIKRSTPRTASDTRTLSKDYFVGLNYLLNEQPDKAIETFSHALEVNSDTIDTHIALGNVFRLRGEADRAAKIHQNLLARPALSDHQSAQVQLELARDFFRLGVLDRSERLLVSLLKTDTFTDVTQASRRLLIDIFEREREWHEALDTAQPLLKQDKKLRRDASYWQCELAQKSIDHGQLPQARKQLRQALSIDANCLRANWLLADIEHINARYEDELKYLKRMHTQDSHIVGLTLPRIVGTYNALDDHDGLVQYLNALLHHHPNSSALIALAERTRTEDGPARAAELLSQQLKRSPSLKGVDYLLALYLEGGGATDALEQQLDLLKQHTEHLLKLRPSFQCGECGFKSRQHYWQCPQCRQWGAILPITGIEGE